MNLPTDSLAEVVGESSGILVAAYGAAGSCRRLRLGQGAGRIHPARRRHRLLWLKWLCPQTGQCGRQGRDQTDDHSALDTGAGAKHVVVSFFDPSRTWLVRLTRKWKAEIVVR